jgi:uncharacterized protein YdeI (YjbR/CyaY-like superfamily)
MGAIEAFFNKADQWEPLMQRIRPILLDAGMVEALKWGMPTYSLNGSIVVGMVGFKNWLALWFYQGVFLTDPKGLLVSGTEGKTKGQRQWRIKTEAEFDLETLQLFVNEAIQNVIEGKAISIDRKKELDIPLELANALSSNEELFAAFDIMSLSHKREYAEYVAEAKQETTRLRRVEKIIPMILSKFGLNDKYKGKC